MKYALKSRQRGWLQALGAIAGAVGSGFLEDSFKKGQTEFNKEQQLDLMQKTPAAQMKGFADAGLNPMLVYQQGSFPSLNAGSGITSPGSVYSQIQGASAASTQAETAASVGEASSALMRAQTKTEGFRAAVAQNDAIKGNYAVMNLAGVLDAAMKVTGEVGPQAISMLEQPRIRAGLAELRAALASANNDAQVFEALNSKAVQVALDVLGKLTGSGNAIAGAVDRYRARSQRGDIINLNKE